MQERGGFKCLNLIGIWVIIPSPANPIFFSNMSLGAQNQGPDARCIYTRSITCVLLIAQWPAACSCVHVTTLRAVSRSRKLVRLRSTNWSGKTVSRISVKTVVLYYSEKRVSNIFSVLMLFWYISLGFFFSIVLFFYERLTLRWSLSRLENSLFDTSRTFFVIIASSYSNDAKKFHHYWWKLPTSDRKTEWMWLKIIPPEGKLCLAGDTFDMVSRMFKWIMRAKYLNVHKVSKNIDLTKLKNNELK